MKKLFAVIALAAFLALGSLSYALAQTTTPSLTPTPTTSVPSGSPSTGYGTVER